MLYLNNRTCFQWVLYLEHNAVFVLNVSNGLALFVLNVSMGSLSRAQCRVCVKCFQWVLYLEHNAVFVLNVSNGFSI